jgi:hypothetical protein
MDDPQRRSAEGTMSVAENDFPTYNASLLYK